ncbi:MAG TPA: hypothetical protein VFH70_13405 [Acidimicrobiales bacterium]|nr:hypothetical protein [Acidimicrobiales bacterium]
MAVYDDCRHYLHRSTPAGDAVQRCRLSANTENPFACPDGCLFHESRSLSGVGWVQAPTERMSNTADGLDALPPPKRKKPKKRR